MHDVQSGFSQSEGGGIEDEVKGEEGARGVKRSIVEESEVKALAPKGHID